MSGEAPSTIEARDPSGRIRLDDGDWAFLKRLVFISLFGLLLYFAWLTSDVLLLAFAAVLVGVMLKRLADALADYTPVPRSWSVLVAALLVIALLVGFLALFGTQIAGQATQLMEQLPRSIDKAGDLIGISNAFSSLNEAVTAQSHAGSVLSRAAGFGYSAIGALADLALVVVAGIYFAQEPELYRRGLVMLLPPAHHARALDALEVTGAALGRWFLGQLGTMLLVGIASGAAFWLIGLPSPLALGVIAGATNIVPFVGPILGAIPALVFATVIDMQTALWTLGAVFVIQQLEGNVITPMIQRQAVSLPPALVLFAIVVFGVTFGWLGVFLAVPLSVAISVLVKKLWVRQTLGERTKVPGETHPDAGKSVAATGS